MGGTLLAIETSQSWERPGEHGEDEEVVWSSSPSGPLEPCFMIFLYLERLFWNHIFTFSKQKRKKRTLQYLQQECRPHFLQSIKQLSRHQRSIFMTPFFLWYWHSEKFARQLERSLLRWTQWHCCVSLHTYSAIVPPWHFYEGSEACVWQQQSQRKNMLRFSSTEMTSREFAWKILIKESGIHLAWSWYILMLKPPTNR